MTGSLDNGYREAADFDAGSRAFAAALVGVNSAYKNVAEGEAVAIQKEIDKYVVAATATPEKVFPFPKQKALMLW